MNQQTLAGFEKYGKTTRRAQFLAEMEQVMLWDRLCALIEPFYPKGGDGEGGRPPVPLERMLRIYLLQLWFNLSDPAIEESAVRLGGHAQLRRNRPGPGAGT